VKNRIIYRQIHPFQFKYGAGGYGIGIDIGTGMGTGTATLDNLPESSGNLQQGSNEDFQCCKFGNSC
jgi:hypothetical protein